VRAGTISARSAPAHARRWLVTAVTICPRSRALLAANSNTSASKLARDRPGGRCLSTPPTMALVPSCMAATPKPPLLHDAAAAPSAARARPSDNLPDRPAVAAEPVEHAAVYGTQNRKRAGSPLPSPPAPAAPGTPNTFESCRTAESGRPTAPRNTPPDPHWITKATPLGALTGGYAAAPWITKASTGGSLVGCR
jgi:hypothetical protein